MAPNKKPREVKPPQQPSEGHRLLNLWFKSHGHIMADLAAAVGVSVPTVHAWRHGHKTPRGRHRLAIEVATGRAVRPADWVTDADRVALGTRAA